MSDIDDLKWAKSMIQHYLKCGYLPEFSAMEAKAFLGEDKDWPNPYERVRELESRAKK